MSLWNYSDFWKKCSFFFFFSPWIAAQTSSWPSVNSWRLVPLSPHGTLALSFFTLFISSCSPPSFPSTLCGWLSFSLRRYLKGQITMATISHTVIAHTRLMAVFILEGLPRHPYLTDDWPTNLFQEEEGTMLPSVGPTCLHTKKNTPSIPGMTHGRQSHAN